MASNVLLRRLRRGALTGKPALALVAKGLRSWQEI